MLDPISRPCHLYLSAYPIKDKLFSVFACTDGILGGADQHINRPKNET